MKKLLLIFVWLISIILILVNIFLSPKSFIANGTILLGWILFAIQSSWNLSEFFYMFLKKIWFFLKNPDCNWNMVVEFNGNFTIDVFNKIDDVFSNQISNYKIISLSYTRKIYRLGSLSFEINLESDQKIILQMEDNEVSYRRSVNLVENELGVLFERLSKQIKEDTTDYYLNISFNDYNSYFGFFIRRLNAEDINTFNVKFNIENDRVTINKNSIEVYTTSFQQLTIFSKQYLTLSPR